MINLGGGKSGRACPSYIAHATPPINKKVTNRVRFATNLNSSTNSSTSEIKDSAPDDPSKAKKPTTDNLLKSILTQMKEMQTAHNSRFDGIDVKLKKLDKIPDLVLRMESTEAELVVVKRDIKSLQEHLDQAKGEDELQQIQRDIDSLRQQVDEIIHTKNTVGTSELPKEESQLKRDFLKRNAELSVRQEKSFTRENTFAELVIGSLTVPGNTDIKTLVTAVFATICPDHNRTLFSKSVVGSAVATVVESLNSTLGSFKNYVTFLGEREVTHHTTVVFKREGGSFSFSNVVFHIG